MKRGEGVPKGAIEFHQHSSPSIVPRVMTDFEMAVKAKQHGYAGIVIKAHEGSTVERAWLAEQWASGIRCYGGVVLNDAVGGIHPAAVEMALRLGGRIVWLPTADARQHRLFFSRGRVNGGLSVFDENGKLTSHVHEIISLIKEHRAILATGHISAQEIRSVVDAALEANLEKIVINHADMRFLQLTETDQSILSRKGVFLEKCYLTTLPPWNDMDMNRTAEHIRKFGSDRIVLATDLGQMEHPDPVEGMSRYCDGLRRCGITETELERMVCRNPSLLLEE